jgi:glycosyltransferase involved in cell wall biosynthesis
MAGAPNESTGRPIRVAWFSYFPIEWQPNIPEELANLPKLHPATWQTVLYNEFQNDPRLDLHVIVLRKDFPRNLSLKRGNTTIHCLKTPGGLRAGSFYWIDTLLVSGALRRIKPDLVHAWGTEFAAAAVATRLRYPALITIQGILNWLKTIFPLNRHQKIGAFLERGALKKARFVTAESSFSMSWLKEHYPALRLRQIEHAPNPLFASVNRNPSISPIRIIVVSSLSHAKGGDVLLEALWSLEGKLDYQLTWIGGRDPRLEDQLRRGLHGKFWQRITWKNDLTPAQIAEELSTATFLVYPTRADSSPNAVKEAVVAGLPVVASRVGGLVDYVFPDRNGVLFESGNPESCAQAIQTAAAHSLFSKGLVDPDTLAHVRDYLSSKTMAGKFLAAYQEVLDFSGSAG